MPYTAMTESESSVESVEDTMKFTGEDLQPSSVRVLFAKLLGEKTAHPPEYNPGTRQWILGNDIHTEDTKEHHEVTTFLRARAGASFAPISFLGAGSGGGSWGSELRPFWANPVPIRPVVTHNEVYVIDPWEAYARTLRSRGFSCEDRLKSRIHVAKDRALPLSLASSYKGMRLVTLQSKEQAARLKSLRAMNRTVENMCTKIGMKNNVIRKLPKNCPY